MKATFTIIMLLSFLSFVYADITDDIVNSIRTGNSKSLSGFFADNIDLTVLDKEGVYSKAQAEFIVKDFFAKHFPKDFKIVHQGESKDGAKFTIGALTAGDGNFRVYILVKKTGDKNGITQLRFEAPEK